MMNIFYLTKIKLLIYIVKMVLIYIQTIKKLSKKYYLIL